MNNIIYIILKCIYYFSKNKEEKINNYFRNKGVKIGKNCKIYSNIITSESYLVTIKNNVTISNDVQLITHDNSIIKINPDFTDVFGEIIIEDDVFIGARTLLLPGIKLAKGVIVGSGSVVTKSFLEENIIIAGNPAKKIRVINDEFKEKISKNGLNISNLTKVEKVKKIKENQKKYLRK